MAARTRALPRSPRLAALLLAFGPLLGCEPPVRPSPDLAATAAGPKEAPGARLEATQPSPEPERKAYGDPLTGKAERVSLHDLLTRPDRYADRTIRTEGKITAVCQGRGCWLELAEEGGLAHVKLGAHRFFVPRSSSGKRAEVEAKVLPAVEAGHCEQEAVEQTGKVARVELDATGVELFADR